eukprot:TRINITY_DN5432_c0_g1_i1.p1 TRINITY_DN5432_c0_g1~~TRINITY_DN5432_c0_g1_i1.p1  ORF type:complete len:379 (-),score=58.73 TRINITY_DN5432_c0_g1_i1:52-1188(-)
MALSVRRVGRLVNVCTEGNEASQQADDDVGRLVQWTLGSPQERWDVRFVFTHYSGPNGGSVLGIGFGMRDVNLEEVDIMSDPKLIVCDAFDGEVNTMGEKMEGVELSEPGTSPFAEEESMTAVYDSTRGFVRFSVTSPRCKGTGVAEITSPTLKNLELYPTVAFAKQRSKVRIEVRESKMQMPLPTCERLKRADYSEYFDSDSLSGRVTFRVDSRCLKADRFLLAARSEYFERMLGSGMVEGSASEVAIPRASFSGFEAVLRFIYSAGQAGEALFKDADPLEVLHLSVEFLLDDLVRLCEWRLLQNLAAETALGIFGSVASVRAKVPMLAEACVQRLRGRMAEMCTTVEFSEFCHREDVVRELFVALDEPYVKRQRHN